MLTLQRFATNLRCASCVARVKPHLDRVPGLESWEVDTRSPEKTLTVSGAASAEDVREAVERGGFEVLRELGASEAAAVASAPAHHASHGRAESSGSASSVPEPSPTTYLPILMLGAYLVGVVGLVEVRAGAFAWERAMGTFMGAFFIAFSFFKMLNLRGFADAYRTYDIVAKRVPAYGYAYPFIELGLGVAYVLGAFPMATNIVTLVVMSVSSVGVIQSLMKKRRIQCACLGTVFNLPMSSVTLIEDGLMVVMAAAAIVSGGH